MASHHPNHLPVFQTLLERYGSDVYRFLLGELGYPDAEDCYQETWIAALRGYAKLEHQENLRGWLLTIALHKATDAGRARGRTPTPAGRVPEQTLHIAAHGHEDHGGGDSQAEVWDAVRQLPTKQRQAVVLRYAVDAGYATIATVMGTSEAAARRNVYEGLRKLRKECQREC